ncbi:Rossmann-like and DUF2520 domain-containing protein [Adhaeribacter rhizoryzae]|uniref:DUF2520 domain-containing protein n=1 Tax=Adhaeribacter rhizoryzae TaxID=2607907 RepID=A0A5M6CWE4_9BACT|nr:Rossmann-like and DUF2520 domain-containing protein [Adhaeribacter rhizoryzae]KAA5539534.1 DUF2520 domain-containing protein [Adhaeribacter rhizoryzae]
MSVANLPQSLRITLVGSGQVATHLGLAFAQAGHQVVGVYSRQLAHAIVLANQLPPAIATNNLDFRNQPACDIYLVSVSDAAVASVIAEAQFPLGSYVVHTSGSLPVTVLARPDLELRTGVFYPIQTFSRNQPVNLATTPIALEAAEPALTTLLQQLAASISQQVIFMAGPDRKKLHLAAVFACNFTNHLLGISREILLKNNLEPGLLNPLIRATLEKSFSADPFTVQTGPAMRGDANILQEHLQMLAPEPLYQQVYGVLSESIQAKK